MHKKCRDAIWRKKAVERKEEEKYAAALSQRSVSGRTRSGVKSALKDGSGSNESPDVS